MTANELDLDFKLLASLDQLQQDISSVLARHDRIAVVLAHFYEAELSASSCQPILDLAVELNPGLTR